MKADLQTVVVPFPAGLMSTARAPAVMPAAYGVEVRNMLLLTDGAGAKRYGCVVHGPELVGETIRAMFAYQFAGGEQWVCGTDSGKVYLLAGGSWTLLKSGMDVDGVLRGCVFAGKLVLCNGADAMLVWDGVELNDIEEFVTDPSAGLTYLGVNQFSIESEIALYAVGTKVKAVLAGGSVESVVSAVSEAAGAVTVTLADSLLNNTLSDVAYGAKPPKLAYVYAAHDRLWGFGLAAIGPEISGHVDRSRVFYTDGLNDVTAWHDPEGNVPSINLADKSGGQDEVLAMAVKDGMTVFFLRQTTQLWTGTDPRVEGDFAWSKTLPVGVVHGSLVAEMPNDVLFVSRNGARTLSRALQTEQLDVADIGGEIDPTWQEVVRQLAVADVYRSIGKVRHEGQGWFGFKLPGRMLVLQVTQRGFGWSVFDGLFAEAGALGIDVDGAVKLAVGGQLYAYTPDVWDDDGEPIACRWVTPWIAKSAGKRWANRYVEVLTAPGIGQEMKLTRYWNHDLQNGMPYVTQSAVAPDHWDGAEWDGSLWDNGRLQVPLVRDAYVADVGMYAVESETGQGPLVIFGLRLHGTGEK